MFNQYQHIFNFYFILFITLTSQHTIVYVENTQPMEIK